MIIEHDEARRGPVLVVELSRMEAPPKKMNLFDGKAVRCFANEIIDHYNGSRELQKDTKVVMQHIPNGLAMTVIDQAICSRKAITEKQMANVAAFLTHEEISDSILLSCIRKWSLFVKQHFVSQDALAVRAGAAHERLRKEGGHKDTRWEWGKPHTAITRYPKGGIIPLAVQAKMREADDNRSK